MADLILLVNKPYKKLSIMVFNMIHHRTSAKKFTLLVRVIKFFTEGVGTRSSFPEN